MSKAHLTFVIGIGIGTTSILAFLQGTFSDGWFASVSEIGFIIAITVLLEILIIFSKKKFYTSLDQAKLSRKIKVLIVPVLLVSILSCQNKSNEEILKNASKNNDREKLITILKKGVDINVKNDLGYTPLMIASLNGYTNMVKIMLNHEADVNARTVFNTNALMQAAWNGHLEIVKLLLDANADIHVKSVGGWTPLFFAAVGNYIGYPSIVNLLIEKGSEVDIKDNIYMMPIQWAITHKCNKSVELLKKHSKK